MIWSLILDHSLKNDLWSWSLIFDTTDLDLWSRSFYKWSCPSLRHWGAPFTRVFWRVFSSGVFWRVFGHFFQSDEKTRDSGLDPGVFSSVFSSVFHYSTSNVKTKLRDPASSGRGDGFTQPSLHLWSLHVLPSPLAHCGCSWRRFLSFVRLSDFDLWNFLIGKKNEFVYINMTINMTPQVWNWIYSNLNISIRW